MMCPVAARRKRPSMIGAGALHHVAGNRELLVLWHRIGNEFFAFSVGQVVLVEGLVVALRDIGDAVR